MATGPKIAGSPLELLESKEGREPPLLSKLYGPTVGGVLGFLAVVTGNWGTRRPYFSGIQRHILVAAGCAYLGKLADDYRNQYLADRDAIMYHYVQLHPEDFPAYERVQYKNVFEPWYPIR